MVNPNIPSSVDIDWMLSELDEPVNTDLSEEPMRIVRDTDKLYLAVS